MSQVGQQPDSKCKVLVEFEVIVACRRPFDSREIAKIALATSIAVGRTVKSFESMFPNLPPRLRHKMTKGVDRMSLTVFAAAIEEAGGKSRTRPSTT